MEDDVPRETSSCNRDDKKSEWDDLDDVPIEQSECDEDLSTRGTRVSEHNNIA